MTVYAVVVTFDDYTLMMGIIAFLLSLIRKIQTFTLEDITN
jgi:hypothetical protein